MKNAKGLSLIEILVVLIITGLIAACVSAAVIGGYYMLKQAEHKSRAMSITHVKLQEYLSHSFDNLQPGQESGNESNISNAFVETQDNTYFNWTVFIDQDKTMGANRVPYKNVTVETKYSEVDPQGKAVNTRTIRLSNVVPYPLIHILSRKSQAPFPDGKYEAPRTDLRYYPGMKEEEYNWAGILDGAKVLDFNYAVPKDLIIMYNLAISYDTDHPPDPDETVMTRCRIDNGGTEGIITRTPIRSQVFINNILQVGNVGAGPHTVHIEWCHESDNAGVKVWLRAYDVTVVAVEYKDNP
ncbi:MAG TPA: type II secretion system protein [Candidatus Omnitrophota bacterium]|nr:type II secretion system protein [Candidatus Omnitrophota bacterium]HQJ16280.1 type II secretion system protein [Candidatus Omnitrophota bacterium]